MVDVISDTSFLIHLATNKIRNFSDLEVDIGKIEFIVPNMAGEFEFASFENSGKDYDAGMKGIFKVFPNENQRVTRWHDRGWRNTPTPKSE